MPTLEILEDRHMLSVSPMAVVVPANTNTMIALMSSPSPSQSGANSNNNTITALTNPVSSSPGSATSISILPGPRLTAGAGTTVSASTNSTSLLAALTSSLVTPATRAADQAFAELANAPRSLYQTNPYLALAGAGEGNGYLTLPLFRIDLISPAPL